MPAARHLQGSLAAPMVRPAKADVKYRRPGGTSPVDGTKHPNGGHSEIPADRHEIFPVVTAAHGGSGVSIAFDGSGLTLTSGEALTCRAEVT